MVIRLSFYLIDVMTYSGTSLKGVNRVCACVQLTEISGRKKMFPTVSHETSDRRTECCRPAYPLTKDRVILPNYFQLFNPQMLQKRKKRAGEQKGKRREGRRKESR